MALLALWFESGESTFSVRRFRVEERMNGLFTASITALSPHADLDLSGIVGQQAAFVIASGLDGALVGGRRWSGVCNFLEQVRVEPSGLSTYDLTIVPHAWLLTQRRNHRLFQHKSVPEILDKLFAEWNLEPTWRVDRGRYPKLELRVQYGESDWDFVSRLVEEAGISVYFVESEQGSRLCFDDKPHAGDARLGPPLPFADATELLNAGRIEHVTAVRVSEHVRPRRTTTSDFDFRRPRYRILSKSGDAAASLEAMLEQYHYVPGAALAETGKAGDTPSADDKGFGRHAEATIQTLVEQAQRSHRALRKVVKLQSNAFDLAPGVIFSMSGHPRSDLGSGQRLLVTYTRVEGEEGKEWSLDVKALFADEPYHPPAVTQKPRIHGIQNAIVVGPDGQEIHTDEYGRVRVQFPWDRDGGFDEDSSIWLRVSQGWAGGGYGMMTLPRVGSEVLVQFLDGDPDHPLVVGRAFNGSATVPYALPDNKTVSTWKSASTPGGEGANEIKMEDLKGQELLYVQAERDHATLVKHDEVRLVGRNRTTVIEKDEVLSIKEDRTMVVQHDERATVQNDRVAIVGHDEHGSVGHDRLHQVKRNDTLAVGASRAVQVGEDASYAVGANRATHIGKSDQVSVGQDQSVTVGQSRSTKVGVNDSTLVGSQYSVTIANGIGGKLSSMLGGLLDGSALGGLGKLIAPVMAGPLEEIASQIGKGSLGATPLATLIQGPVATLKQFLPGPLQSVASMVSGPLEALLGGGEPPTTFMMEDKRIVLTTGDATITLEGGTIVLQAKEGIALGANTIEALAKQLMRLQAGLPAAEAAAAAAAEGDAEAAVEGGIMLLSATQHFEAGSPEGTAQLAAMKGLVVGSKDTLAVMSEKGMQIASMESLDIASKADINVVASGEAVVIGTMVKLNPPGGPAKKEKKFEEQEGDASPEEEKELGLEDGVKPDGFRKELPGEEGEGPDEFGMQPIKRARSRPAKKAEPPKTEAQRMIDEARREAWWGTFWGNLGGVVPPQAYQFAAGLLSKATPSFEFTMNVLLASKAIDRNTYDQIMADTKAKRAGEGAGIVVSFATAVSGVGGASALTVNVGGRIINMNGPIFIEFTNRIYDFANLPIKPF